MATPPVSLDEFKAHLNKTTASSADDAELTMMLDAATEFVESQCGPMTTVEHTQTVTYNGRDAVLLEHWPVDGVSAPTEFDATVSRLGAGLVAFTAAGTYDVTYQAGRSNVPASLKLATLIIAAHLWETQRGTSTRPQWTEADEYATSTAAGASLVSRGFAVPRRAAELMRPYLRGPAR